MCPDPSREPNNCSRLTVAEPDHCSDESVLGQTGDEVGQVVTEGDVAAVESRLLATQHRLQKGRQTLYCLNEEYILMNKVFLKF